MVTTPTELPVGQQNDGEWDLRELQQLYPGLDLRIVQVEGQSALQIGDGVYSPPVSPKERWLIRYANPLELIR